MKYINEFLRKKKPETFVDYAPGEIPKKPTKAQEPLTLGEVAPKATERVAPRVTTKEESTYTTSNKDLQNIHRNRTNAERHTGRSLRDESNRRTTYVGDDAHTNPHSRENDSANPYGSPVKIVGDAAKLARIGANAIDVTSDARRAVKAGKSVYGSSNEIADIGKVAGRNIRLNPTHIISKSKKQMRELIEDIQKNGIKEPIKYINVNGEKFVVDGHRRLYAARALGLESIPIEEVKFPYKNYLTINDLFWE